uniref:Uncharacterized protein n=1 Tax=Triticum urartu TaxID=4572 RepID=A0A8R7R3A4_TRIUA
MTRKHKKIWPPWCLGVACTSFPKIWSESKQRRRNLSGGCGCPVADVMEETIRRYHYRCCAEEEEQ